jgi:hypothetical protein
MIKMATVDIDRAKANLMQRIANDSVEKGYDIADHEGVRLSYLRPNARVSFMDGNHHIVNDGTFTLLKDRSKNRIMRLLRVAGLRDADNVAKLNFAGVSGLTIEVYGKRNRGEMIELAERIGSEHKLDVKIIVESMERRECQPVNSR